MTKKTKKSSKKRTKATPTPKRKACWPPYWDPVPEDVGVVFPNDIYMGPGGNRCTPFLPTYPNEQDDESKRT